jgi:hypothetical protein
LQPEPSILHWIKVLKDNEIRPMKQRLFRNWRGLSFALIASLGVAVAASSNPGYLRRVGPSPLRFSPAPRPCVGRFVLPIPLPQSEFAAGVSQAEMTPPIFVPKPSAIITEARSGPDQPSRETAPPEAMVPAQVFLKYFNQSTNASASAGAPMNFTPPKPAGPFSGAATHSPDP